MARPGFERRYLRSTGTACRLPVDPQLDEVSGHGRLRTLAQRSETLSKRRGSRTVVHRSLR